MQYIGFMNTFTSLKSIQRQSLREEIYQQLKTAIIQLELKPGEKVRDQDLAETFHVSRTPVREALRRLEDEGLIVTSPGSFTRIAEINLEEVKNATIVVASLHSLAANLAFHKLTEEDLHLLNSINNQLKVKLEQKDVSGAVEADGFFHGIFLNRSDNQEICRALEPVESKIRRLEFAKFNTTEAIKSVQVHQEIIDACRESTSQSVTKLIEKNWLSLFDLLAQ